MSATDRASRRREDCVKLGAALRAERERQGMSHTDLSRASGLHRTHISRIERGLCEPTLKTLLRLRQGLGSLAAVFATLEREAGDRDAVEGRARALKAEERV